MKRALLVALVVVVVMVALAGCAGANGNGANGTVPDDDSMVGDDPPEETDQPPPEPIDGEVAIHHIDVGQADSTLVVTPTNETILIDTGDWWQNGSEVISYLEAHDVDRIDHLVATHAHADHIGGHAAIIEHFEEERNGIGAIYDSGVPHTTQTYENYLDAVDEYDHELLVVEEGDELPIEDDDVDALVVNPPAGESGDDLHYNSVSIVLKVGGIQYLTTGDAETEAEERMTEVWADDLDVDIYQAGHHGSSTSSSEGFMDVVTPEYAIVSSDYDSQYGHPHDETLDRFAAMAIETYWTGVHGDVVVETDGQNVTIETSEPFSTDAADLKAEKPNNSDAYSITIGAIDTPRLAP